ncbi:hypothetical protein LTR12_002116 [Friedmanniomyces endolithicus]|nr:hypothetical protein LTR12_002116 [Friedmanniomyces endolithicus]
MATTPPRTLPASWYTSRPLCQLERRAVFLKSWYLLGPIIKSAPGTFVDYEFAGVHLTVNATSPTDTVGKHQSPTITVLDSTTGIPLRHHTTTTGLLFTTISPLAPPFHTFFPNLEATLSAVDFTARPHRRSISYEGHFNWKTMIDGYQECLHCQYTHPAFSLLYPPTFYAVKNHHNWCQHYADAARPDDGLFLYFLPNCTLNVYGGGMSLFRVADEDFELCETVQGNLERGVYAEGVLNSVKENGVAYYQQRVLEMVLEQHQEDRQQARTREAEEASASTSAVKHAPGRHGNSIPNRAIVEASA